jgi:hypothetical protein
MSSAPDIIFMDPLEILCCNDGGTAHLRECPKISNGVLEIQMQRAGAIIKADRPLC